MTNYLLMNRGLPDFYIRPGQIWPDMHFHLRLGTGVEVTYRWSDT